MKRWRIAAIILMVLPLTGCLKQYSVSDQKADAIAEYMAGTLLVNDRIYKEKLISEDELGVDDPEDEVIPEVTITPPPEPTKDPQVGTPGIGTDGSQSYNLSQVIGVPSFHVSYVSMKRAERYPENASGDYYGVDYPRPGYEFMVLTFKVDNLRAMESRFNLMRFNLHYIFTDDNGARYQPLFTLLMNDMQYIDMTVAGGGSKPGVLVFEIPKNSTVTKSTLTVANGQKKVTIQLK